MILGKSEVFPVGWLTQSFCSNSSHSMRPLQSLSKSAKSAVFWSGSSCTFSDSRHRQNSSSSRPPSSWMLYLLNMFRVRMSSCESLVMVSVSLDCTMASRYSWVRPCSQTAATARSYRSASSSSSRSVTWVKARSASEWWKSDLLAWWWVGSPPRLAANCWWRGMVLCASAASWATWNRLPQPSFIPWTWPEYPMITSFLSGDVRGSAGFL
mmetsp:Transcript_1892/g.2937  ORF Transcript_1892/g.2937 Transcript_1892/m.2937 type:complete len:211 (+) Transcript_1892:179-811(+)